MIARYNNISLALGVPGLVMQVAANVMSQSRGWTPVLLASSLVGTGLLLTAFAFYAMAKGRNPAWCLFAFLSLIGLIVLACLKDMAPSGRIKKKKKRRQREEDDDEEDDRPRRRRRRDEEEDLDDDDDRPRQRRRSRDDDEDDLDEPPPPRPKKVIDAEAIKPVNAEKRIVTCSNCQKSLKVPGSLAGKKVKCPSCGDVFVA